MAVTPVPRAPFTSPLAERLSPGLLDRFTRYVRVSTQSDREAEGSPSTARQLDLSRMLVGELQEIGLSDVALDDDGYVYATLPATTPAAPDGTPWPVVGLIAHVDTSPDAPGEGVEPLVHESYDGGEIRLPKGGTVLDPARMPELTARVGHDLVTSSGDTLLGADDKAGVAEIVTALAHLAAHPELPRPTLRVCFTPDEEIGRGAHRFDVEGFGAVCAYTVDGSEPGELQDETFTAAGALVSIDGHDVHPGFATGKLVNAARLAARIVAALPPELTPEATSGRQGFIHVFETSGTAAHAEVHAIIRDFDDDLLAGHADLLRSIVAEVAADAPGAELRVTIEPQYPNMREHIARFPAVVTAAERAIEGEGLTLVRTAIRGGTDGSQLSAMGLPTPNVFTGGHEYHSVREWASLQEMSAAAATVVRIAEAWTAPDLVAAAAAGHLPA
ncbi:peptidase T [Patulibacter sp.]|uniref:peptidase T n=1 Tax=Patulibacter sp. TaxID=1912859 RepID=UPI002720506D|nr:peptidase T [Patulibacter sp.]MDO9410495.1 peptidase T [Patulibacter sp.]